MFKKILLGLAFTAKLMASPSFVPAKPVDTAKYQINGSALCKTAKETLVYLNRGASYDPLVIHEGKVFKLPLAKVKATLEFICQHQNELNDPAFVRQHFEFIRWYPNLSQARVIAKNKPLLQNLPQDKILMTKYYVHKARVSSKLSKNYPLALYAIPQDEVILTLEEADAKPELLRFKYGKQAILKGALNKKEVPVLAYLNREDLEAALLQGTIIADFKNQQKTFNVHRSNNIAYDRTKNPYKQERYWYFKEVKGVKGYGKDADEKITVEPGVTYAADLENFGLGKLLLIQYKEGQNTITRAGIFADTGGAFANNQYQIDFLTGSYAGLDAFYKANHHLPNYVAAYFMVLK